MAILESLTTPRPRQRQFLHRAYLRHEALPEPFKGSQALAKPPKAPREPLTLDEQIEAVARRRARVHDKATDTMVRVKPRTDRVRRRHEASWRWVDQDETAALWLPRRRQPRRVRRLYRVEDG